MTDKLTPNVLKLIDLLETDVGDIELVSYGLAPNPNGFCYEVYNTYNVVDTKKIDAALNSLTKLEEVTIRELYLE